MPKELIKKFGYVFQTLSCQIQTKHGKNGKKKLKDNSIVYKCVQKSCKICLFPLIVDNNGFYQNYNHGDMALAHWTTSRSAVIIEW